MRPNLRLPLVSSLFCAVFLAACFAGGDASVGGTLSGLPASTSVTLQNNAADNLTLSADGSFTFVNTLFADDTYSVTVLTQPVSANCTVASGTGTIDKDENNVTSVQVTCTLTASVTGTVSGLASGTSLVLTNGSTTLPIASNGAFAFPGVLSAGATYSVAVSTQPVGQTCVVSNGTGTVVTGTATNIGVTCT